VRQPAGCGQANCRQNGGFACVTQLVRQPRGATGGRRHCSAPVDDGAGIRCRSLSSGWPCWLAWVLRSPAASRRTEPSPARLAAIAWLSTGRRTSFLGTRLRTTGICRVMTWDGTQVIARHVASGEESLDAAVARERPHPLARRLPPARRHRRSWQISRISRVLQPAGVSSVRLVGALSGRWQRCQRPGLHVMVDVSQELESRPAR
jgi:hypothetical protein